jgi:hypothetical protein
MAVLLLRMPRARSRKFTLEEDIAIARAKLGIPSESWDDIAKRLEGRTAGQCQRRWTQYLAPEISSEPWTPEEDQLLVDKVNEVGLDWAAMKPSFSRRGVFDIRNRWHCHIRSKTVHDGTKFIYTESNPNWPDNQRKGYGQRKTCPDEAVVSSVQEEMEPKTTQALLMNSARESVRDVWDQMTTEDEWFPLTPREPEESVGTIVSSPQQGC